ncbi:MAG: MarR family winged helix-turn-helix transcriptional regulator [Steroidobacteraceae bacterium]
MSTDRFRQLGFLFKDVSRRYTRRFEERAQRLALSLPECRALIHLQSNEGVSQKRLAELADVDPMTLVRILDRMEADGWVQRRFDPADRRAHTLWLTPAAAPVLEQIWQLITQTRAEMLQGLSNEERALLVTLLERVHANLTALPPLSPEESAAPEDGRRPTRSNR